MRRLVVSILGPISLSIFLAACVSNAQPQDTTPAAADGSTPAKTCHEEAITGSNMTRTVCSDTRTNQDDRDQQLRDLSGAHNMPNGGK